jgi:hypothetical protein
MGKEMAEKMDAIARAAMPTDDSHPLAKLQH